MNASLFHAVVLCSAIVGGACSSSTAPGAPPSPSGAGGAQAASASSSSTSGVTAAVGSGGFGNVSSGAGGSMCPPTVVPGTGVSQTVDTVQGTVVDPTGAPIAGVLALVCGLNLCTKNAMTDANGTALIAVGGQSLVEPAFKFGDGYKHARFAVPLPTGTAAIDFPQSFVTVALPATGVPFTPGTPSVSGGVTLTMPSNGVVTVDTLTYEDPDQQLFRAAEIPVDKAASVLDPALGLAILYGVGPVETTFCPRAQVTIPNELGWAAGTAVEFFIHGVDVGEEWVPYGGWAKASDGAVSADGKTIATSDGGGLPVLTAFGVRKR